MQTSPLKKTSLEQLQYLPPFAGYILSNRLKPFIEQLLYWSREFKLPLLKHFTDLSEEEIIEKILKSNTELLDLLSRNKSAVIIENSLKRWVDNQLPFIDRNEVKAEDINLVGYIRKRAFMHFLPEYCKDAVQVVDLVAELDLFFMESEVAATNIYLDLLKENAHEKSHLIENINNTIPGAVYVFDLEKFTNIYSNHKLEEIIGYSKEELNELGLHSLGKLIHVDDQQTFQHHLEVLKKAKDGEIKTIKYRIRNRNGQYRWLSSHESVFKRKKDGSVVQVIGIILDIDKEQQKEEALRENERLHQQAEALTHLGSYTWDIHTRQLRWSEELFRIHGLDPRKESITVAEIEAFIPPEEMQQIRATIQQAIADKSGFDFYYHIELQDKNYKILHARGNVITDQQGQLVSLLGTIQDVTEKQNLIRSLRNNQSLYKQAEELVNMGNWSWDIKNNTLEWTDQLYRIYGLEPQSEVMSIDRFLSFVHPDDREEVARGVEEIISKKRLDFTFRIITTSGKIKILRSVAQVQVDMSGNPVMVMGTERDVTEKQNLIDQLKNSESLYKQAQSLAHMGNWYWDVSSGIFNWSDELFRIYGLSPQDRVIKDTDFFSFIHPEDREQVKHLWRLALESQKGWEHSFKIIRSNGEVRTVFATAEVNPGPEGTTVSMIGTIQDITERQGLIDRLQKSEKLYKQAQSLARLGNWSIEFPSNEFTWSEEMFRIYELEPGTKISFEEWFSYLSKEEAKEIASYFKECILKKQNYDRIHKIYLKNGTVKTIHRKGELIFDENGNPVRMIGTTQDITEEYRVQQELKDNQNFIRKITDATPSIISSYNINTGKYVFISGGLTKLLGYETSQVLEQGVNFFATIMHPDDLQEVNDKNEKVMEEANHHPFKNDQVVEYTYRLRHKNGQYRWFHTYGTIFDRNAENKVEHVLNISLDVTEQVEASKTIKEQEHFIQHIADASPTILYLYDVPSQRIIYINREIFFVLGYLPEEVLEANDAVTELLYHPEDYHLLPGRQQSTKTFQQVDSMIQYECRMKNKEGQWRWLLVREIVFKTDEQGNIIQILGAALDINHRKEMEKTILQNTLLLEQSNASLEEFAYVASHDLKEPLRKISTFGDRLVATQLNNMAPEGRIYLNKIVDASQRMQTMISDLLSISMITGNKSFETSSLQKILEETLQTLEFKIEQLNAVIKSDPLPEANIIPSQFRQLFQNLLSNSLKFVKPDIQPVITITHTFLGAHEVAHYQLNRASRYHRIEFSDNGIGFEPEFAGKIFAIFQRLHGRSEYEGSGIGLAICKKIVEHHGGIIYASGVPDVGATFTIILPA